MSAIPLIPFVANDNEIPTTFSSVAPRSHGPWFSKQDGTDRKRKGARCNRTPQRRVNATGSSKEALLPCIFHIGEPETYPDDRKKYQFISQLQYVLSSPFREYSTDRETGDISIPISTSFLHVRNV